MARVPERDRAGCTGCNGWAGRGSWQVGTVRAADRQAAGQSSAHGTRCDGRNSGRTVARASGSVLRDLSHEKLKTAGLMLDKVDVGQVGPETRRCWRKSFGSCAAGRCRRWASHGPNQATLEA